MDSEKELVEYFKYQCEKGFNKRFPDFSSWPAKKQKQYRDRLKYETSVVLEMGFPGYFLIVWDLVKYCLDNNIPVGLSRGSAASSIICYCLYITYLNPIEWELPFERFLNISRISMPDIDQDVSALHREQVVKYIEDKYGADCVLNIGTFGLMRAKNAVRNVARVLGHPYSVGDGLSKLLLPPIHGKPQSLQTSIDKVPELKEHYSKQSTYGDILRIAEKFEGLVNSVSQHACISGSHEILTLHAGFKKIVDLPVYSGLKPEIILTPEGYKGCWFYSKGSKECISIQIASSKYSSSKINLMVTPNHLLLTKEQGWVEAKDSVGLTVKQNQPVEINKLAELAGWMWNDGYYSITQSKKQIIKQAVLCHTPGDDDEAIDYFREFLKTKQRRDKHGVKTSIADEILSIYGDGFLTNTSFKKPPNEILANSSLELGWLKGFISANGSVQRSSIRIKVVSRQLIDYIKYLLKKYHFRSSKPSYCKAPKCNFPNGTYQCRPAWQIEVSVIDSWKFAQTIGFIQTYKQKRIKEFKYLSHKPLGKQEVYDFTVDTDSDQSRATYINGATVHNCGKIISNQSLSNKVPAFLGKEGEPTAQWEMNNLEALGYVKFDILGLNTLSKIYLCLQEIRQRHDIKLDVYNLDWKDQQVFEVFRSGNLQSVFQFETSQGMMDLCVKVQPNCLKDLAALVAIFRPGPLGSDGLPGYLEWRQHGVKPQYLIPELEPILSDTGGMLVFQEQCASKGSPVWTSSGVEKIEDISRKNVVLLNNSSDQVIDYAQTGLEKKILKITTSYGSLSVTPDHLIPVLDSGNQMKIKRADSLLLDDLIQVVDPRSYSSLKDEDIRPTSELEDAYFLGVLVGDGCLTGGSNNICAGTKEIAEWYSKTFSRYCDWTHIYFNTRAWYVNLSCKFTEASKKDKPRTKLNLFLDKHDLWRKTKQGKKIPKWVLEDRSLMAAFILGMIDSDGHLASEQQPVHVTSTINENIDCLHFMLTQLGIVSRRRKNRVYIINPGELKPVYDKIRTLKTIDFEYWDKRSKFAEALVFSHSQVMDHISRYYTSFKQCSRLTKIAPTTFRRFNDRTGQPKTFITERAIDKLPHYVKDYIFESFPLYARILKVEDNGTSDVYDITTKTSHLFNIDGHIVHNCMKIATDLCGYSGPDSDNLRKIIGKKLPEKMAKEEPKFKDGWVAQGHPREVVDILWAQLLDFASYSFNLSHAASYGTTAYITAYLKTYYPTEWMCAVMICDADNKDQMIKYLAECRRMGLEVSPPDINRSQNTFSIDEKDRIVFGLSPIRNLGEGPVSSIIDERVARGKYKDLVDFLGRTDLSKINKLKVESLVKSGCFDFTGKNRNSLLSFVEKYWEYKSKLKPYESKLVTYQRRKEKCAQRLKDIEEGKTKAKPLKQPELPVRPEIPAVPSLPEQALDQRLIEEHNLLGFYIDEHPLDSFDLRGQIKIDRMKQLTDSGEITFACMVAGKQEITTKKKKEKMAFLTLEDQTGQIEGVAFAKTWSKYQKILESGEPLYLYGYLEVTQGETDNLCKIRIGKVQKLSSVARRLPKKKSTLRNLLIKSDKLQDTINWLKCSKDGIIEVRPVIELLSGNKIILSKVFKVDKNIIDNVEGVRFED